MILLKKKKQKFIKAGSLSYKHKNKILKKKYLKFFNNLLYLKINYKYSLWKKNLFNLNINLNLIYQYYLIFNITFFKCLFLKKIIKYNNTLINIIKIL
uniref:Uncharacterized protein n=1 Tax=Nephromyces sp. ex Molgula occidentalis TaxID=2544991 RepID=A0A5C1H8K6_9APIC|nr:hypothetical protein [Nephromyces sp. ex Molgula occidentalis]